MLTRAGTAPLSMQLDTKDLDARHIAQVLGHLHHTRELEINIAEGQAEMWLSKLSHPAPIMKKLKVLFLPDKKRRMDPIYVSNFLAHDAPRLSQLEIRSARNLTHFSGVLSCFNKLQVLSLINAQLGNNDDTIISPSQKMLATLDMLSSLPNLRRLGMEKALPQISSPLERVPSCDLSLLAELSLLDSPMNVDTLLEALSSSPLLAVHVGCKVNKQRDEYDSCLERITHNMSAPYRLCRLPPAHCIRLEFNLAFRSQGSINITPSPQNATRVSEFWPPMGSKISFNLEGDLNTLRTASAQLIARIPGHEITELEILDFEVLDDDFWEMLYASPVQEIWTQGCTSFFGMLHACHHSQEGSSERREFPVWPKLKKLSIQGVDFGPWAITGSAGMLCDVLDSRLIEGLPRLEALSIYESRNLTNDMVRQLSSQVGNFDIDDDSRARADESQAEETEEPDDDELPLSD
jgi:hypothetical protein